MIKYIVIDEEGNNTIWDEEAELPRVFTDEAETVAAAKKWASDNPGQSGTIMKQIAVAKATVRKPKVTVTTTESA